MPRQKRVEYAGAIYYVMARGNQCGDIVLDDEDRRSFEEALAEVVGRSGWVLYARVLMGSHYHLFGASYKAIPVGEGGYFTRLIHYIHLNPVRTGIVKKKDGIETYPQTVSS